METLKITDLHVETAGTKILQGLSITIKSGETHAIMGQNGSGKSTLCKVLMGHPDYQITSGQITLNDQDITELETHERAQLGLFLAFQHPPEVPGLALGNFLRHAKNAHLKAQNQDTIDPRSFLPIIKNAIKNVNADQKFSGRSVNHGLSGGEKKRSEIIQMQILQPKITLLDEIDSGLDIDALKAVADSIKHTQKTLNFGTLIITHYNRILQHIKPDYVHIMKAGKIVKSGDHTLANTLEQTGYQQI